MSIPETIEAFDAGRAFLFYRDILKLHVYPVDGPWSKKADPGKKPSICGWWNYDPHDCDVAKYFGNNGRCHNIGFAPKNRVVVVDLDSKHDKGESVRRFLTEHPDCTRGPYHETAGGAHLLFICPDLPPIVKPDGKPRVEPLDAVACEGVSAELFHSDHSNIVLPPSTHIQGFVYRWKTFGEIPEVSWQWLRDTFGFSVPANERKGRSKKEAPWHLRFKGDLRSLDLLGMLETLGFPAELIDADDNKYSILCPWHEEHGTQGKTGSSTVVWQRPDTWPQFRCLHAHCSERAIQHLLEWSEFKEPGVVDRFCKRARVYEPGRLDDQHRPRVLHPNDRLESEVHTEIGAILGPKYTWFKRADRIVTIDSVPSGFVYSSNPETEYTIEAHTTGFRELDSREAKSRLEEYVVPGILAKDALDNLEFVKKSFSSDFCVGLVHSVHLRRKLSDILRVLTVPIPVRVKDKLVYPSPRYDARFGTFLVDHAPVIQEMPLEKALKVLENIHREFCFTNDKEGQSGQSRTHAIARLLTPFARGIIGWTTRVPLWFYFGNRPRCGKDYLAAIPLLVYEGSSYEDLPIGKDSEETRKRIMAAARNGRHFMHFSNCQGYLQDQHLAQVITNPVIKGRSLGTNDAASDLHLPNEMEFSLSANVGLTYREDFEPRMRKIELAYFEEDPNARVFQNKFLHQDIKEHRGYILSAIAAIFRNWEKKGFPKGPNPFVSFPAWAEVVGGAMDAAELGDPCLPFKGDYDDAGGDKDTAAMTELFRVCHTKFGDRKVLKKEIYKCVHAAMTEEGGNEVLAYFGELENSEDARKNQTRLGIKLSRFKNRELSGIRLQMEVSSDRAANQYRFIKASDASEKSERLNVSERSRSHTWREKNTKCVEKVFHGKRGTKNEANNVKTHSASGALNVQKGSDVQISEDSPADLSSPTLAVDIETYGEIRTGKNGKILRSRNALNPQKAEIRLLSIADRSGRITLRDLREKPLSPEEREILESRELIAHNASFELRFFGTKLGFIPQQVFCTQTADWLLLPRRERIHDLESSLFRHLGIKISKKGLGASDWGGLVLTEDQIAYARNDTRFLHQLKEQLSEDLDAMKLTAVFEMESRLLPIIAAMECRGFTIDAALMGRLKETADRNAGALAASLRKDFADDRLNPASPQELLQAFKKDGLELADTSEETLCTLEDPRARTILLWRTETKLSSSVKTLLGAEHQGRIHAGFDPLGTVTGRFASRQPNLQNITRGPLRSAFVASDSDRRLIVADYSQIELRVAALIAKEAAMIGAFKTKADLHKITAAAVLRKPIEKVTKDDRQTAKAVSFGFLYGQSAAGFVAYARTTYGLSLSYKDAERFRENFFSTYPAFRRWHAECRSKSANAGNGSARTVFGRLLMARKDDAWARFNMFTEYVVSGSCADLLKTAMIKVASVLPSDVHLVATIHDELVYDAPADMAKQYRSMIRQAMEDAFTEMFGTVVPVEVEAKVCSNWGEK